jgi:hypothetical protein
MRKFLLIFFIVLMPFSLAAQNVVASTSWTAAFAMAAGADSVTFLAPAEMTHPAEYELMPSDIPKVAKADYFVYAGYEVMMDEINKTLSGDSSKGIQIVTQYDWETMEQSVMTIARRMGTIEKAKENLEALQALYEQAAQKAKESSLTGQKALVHRYQVPFAQTLGLEVVGSFGPQPLTLGQINQFKDSDATIILDNIHNPIAKPLQEILPKATCFTLINFPGTKGTKTINDVISYNLTVVTKK